ncbi:MAG: hypothetical protein FJZ59_07110 [Chlamydiae bacterium]|nr:hypothetical protein [Chlamydiota bacterium]
MTSLDKKLILMDMLHSVSYGMGDEVLERLEKPNIFMGVGLWSNKHGLSIGLPMDILHMLIPIRILQEVAILKHPEGVAPKLYVLIADSMAFCEIEKKEMSEKVDLFRKLEEIKSLYMRAIKFLLRALKIDGEVYFLSKLETSSRFEEISKEVSELPFLSELSPENVSYVKGQLVSSRFMHEEFDVGIKIGWSKIPEKRSPHDWDEPRFDAFSKIACRGLSYIYTKAGLNGLGGEAPPYTAFGSKGKRCVLQLEEGIQLEFPKTKDERWEKIKHVCRFLEMGGCKEKEGDFPAFLAVAWKSALSL